MYVSSVKFKDIIKVVPSYSPSIVLAYSESGAENPDVFRLFFHCLTVFSLKTNRPSVPVRNGHGRTLRPVRDPLKKLYAGKKSTRKYVFSEFVFLVGHILQYISCYNYTQFIRSCQRYFCHFVFSSNKSHIFLLPFRCLRLPPPLGILSGRFSERRARSSPFLGL